jgi:periplasmic copper chaperone A
VTEMAHLAGTSRAWPTDRNDRPAGAPRVWRGRRGGWLSARLAVLALGGALALLGFAGTAFAHVTAQPGSATAGGYTKVSFRAPDERDNAATVKLEVFLPPEHPIPSVAVQPLPGWNATVEKTTLAHPITTDDGQVTQAVSKITWSGGRIEPDQFQDFNVSMGPLPTDTGLLVFKALQTYDNGEVVRWIDQPARPGQPEPEHPAPAVHLIPAAGPDPHADGGGGLGLGLGIGGVVLGLTGALAGGLALARTTRAGRGVAHRTPGGDPRG